MSTTNIEVIVHEFGTIISNLNNLTSLQANTEEMYLAIGSYLLQKNGFLVDDSIATAFGDYISGQARAFLTNNHPATLDSETTL